MKKINWLRNKIGRAKLNSTFREHARQNLTPLGYMKYRGISDLRGRGFDPVKFVKSFKGNVRALEVGPGTYKFAGEMKDALGNKLHLTTVDIIEPRVSQRTRRRFGKAISTDPIPAYQTRIQRELTEMLDAKIRAKKVDQRKKGFIEDFEIKNQFEVIFDLYSALGHSEHKERVLDVYFNALKSGGAIIAIDAPLNTIQKEFGINSKRAKTGHYFEITKQGQIIIIRKRAVN